jgi:FkbM family methyltransferase
LGTNELPVQEAVSRSLREGDVFFDIGSNVGFFALIAARRVGPRGASYAFEPVPANVEQIVGNAARNALDNVTVIAGAVSDSAGTATLYLDRHPGGATLSAADLPGGDGGQIEVEVVTIDGLVADRRCRPPDVVKIDVEGAEAAVLRGMERTLAEHRPVVICEVDSATRAGVEAKAAEITAMLEERRYLVERLPDSYGDAAWEVVHLLATPAERSAPQ